MKINKGFWGFCIFSIFLFSCSNENRDLSQLELGQWISLDKKDTLDFVTENDFYRSNENMVYDHYDYQEFKDSIQIGYRGKLFIGVEPTRHKYSIVDNRLTIDFTNKPCYGFENQVTTYQKE